MTIEIRPATPPAMLRKSSRSSLNWPTSNVPATKSSPASPTSSAACSAKAPPPMAWSVCATVCRSASRCSFFSAIPLGWAATACTSKTSTSLPNNGAAAPVKPCCATWRKSPAPMTAAVSNGACWTGTNRRSNSTNPSAHNRRKSGCGIEWMERCCASLPRDVDRWWLYDMNQLFAPL